MGQLRRGGVCQAPPDTYLRICEVIDSTTALMWSCEESYDRCLQLLNSPGESCTTTAWRRECMPVSVTAVA